MSKHTAGPWKVRLDAVTADRGHKRHAIESVGGFWTAEVVGGIDREQQAANARLIASAPELLEALQELAACHTESAGLTMSMAVNQDEFNAMLERSHEWVERAVAAARAAIAKATGEQQ